MAIVNKKPISLHASSRSLWIKGKTDKKFLYTLIVLVLFGFTVYISAASGLMTKTDGSFSATVFKQGFVGLFLGGLLAYLVSHINHRFWQRISLWLLLLGIALNLALFLPGVGITSGGATRWLNLGMFSFQPAEFLKIAFIIYLSSWIAKNIDRIKTFRSGFLPFMMLTGLVGTIFAVQPDLDGLLVLMFASFSLFLVAGARWRHIFYLFVLAGVAFFIFSQISYVKQRINTFFNPQENALTSSYQVQQSVASIGAGEIYGRGFGKSVQKFGALPEPYGDSIFAVFAEEWGFSGSIFLISLFMLLFFFSIRIYKKAPDAFSGLLTLGIVILIMIQSFINVASMLGLFFLSGLPLVFVSHGGTSVLMTLFGVGMILSVSRSMQKY